MYCHRPAKMLFNQMGFAGVSQSVFCAQVCKQTARSWRFCSTVSSVDRKNSDDKILKKFSRTRKMQLRDTHPTHQVPAALTCTAKNTNSTRILDERAAYTIVSAVKKVFDKNKVILNFDAGSGLLSKALLIYGMKKVVALDPQYSFCEMLEELKESHQESFSYFLKNIHDVLAYSNEEFLTNLPVIENFNEGCDVQIIGQVPSWHVLVEIFRRMRDGRSFLFGKSLSLCLCLPQDKWEELFDSKVRKLCVVERILLQLAFEYEILTTLERRCFYFRVKTTDQKKMNPDANMVLIHVKSKPMLDFDLTEFQVFLTQFHNCSSRKRLVIPSLEQWAPSCGEALIRRGMNVFTRFSDLQPEELLELFLYFKSLPSVEATGFLSEWRNNLKS